MSEARTHLGKYLLSAYIGNSKAYEAAAQNYCTVLDIKKVEGLCPDKQLDKAQMHIESLRENGASKY